MSKEVTAKTNRIVWTVWIVWFNWFYSVKCHSTTYICTKWLVDMYCADVLLRNNSLTHWSTCMKTSSLLHFSTLERLQMQF